MWGPIIVIGLTVLAIGFIGLRLWFEATMRYREYLFVPVEPEDLSPATVDFFERHSGDMERLGFEMLGDYLLSLKPWRQWARFLMGPDGRVVGDMTQTDDMRTYNFTSAFSDGTVLESSSLARQNGRKFRYIEEDVYKINHMPEESVEDLYAAHLRMVKDYCRQHDCQALSIEPHQFQDVMEHAHRLSHWNLAKRGFAPEPPPSLAARQHEAAGV